MNFEIGSFFNDVYPPEAADWCNNNNAYIDKIENGYIIKKIPDNTEEEIILINLEIAKLERANAVSNIVVMVDNMEFDGDEISQERMSRTITAAKAMNKSNEDTTTWVLHNNKVAQVTIEQLSKALYLAGVEQTKLWTIPYQNKNSL